MASGGGADVIVTTGLTATTITSTLPGACAPLITVGVTIVPVGLAESGSVLSIVSE
jgi:hypothetical protein